MIARRVLLGAATLLALVALSGLVLWPAHRNLLKNRSVPAPSWRYTPLSQGAEFARSEHDVYPETPQPSPTAPAGTGNPEPLPLAEAEKILLEKGESYVKDSGRAGADHLSTLERDGATGR